MSKATFYKQKKSSMICGVVAGLSDKYGWELPLARILAALFMYIFPGAIVLYIILAVCLPYKEDLEKDGQQKHYYHSSQGSRRRKDAEVIDEEGESRWF
ncbi:PspC domain-containing protein [Streptococcus troglodytae]|uniref:Phage shock protein C n=1 Tax=Streptococcus troglodytae TaxID=1111760 RepID=A0A1L7LKB0_9STRE|nr:PspC domain-containing protein [Streptococcus troglodytae]BAQ24643.1 phage shock protein C [Streptococcus troglodytae]